jgi:hypothetical protein
MKENQLYTVLKLPYESRMQIVEYLSVMHGSCSEWDQIKPPMTLKNIAVLTVIYIEGNKNVHTYTETQDKHEKRENTVELFGYKKRKEKRVREGAQADANETKRVS